MQEMQRARAEAEQQRLRAQQLAEEEARCAQVRCMIHR
jgi:hypothetical protein